MILKTKTINKQDGLNPFKCDTFFLSASRRLMRGVHPIDKKHLFSPTLILVISLAFIVFTMEACNNRHDKNSIVLLARDAAITGNLWMKDSGEDSATIHGWKNTKDQIFWTTKLKKGNYKLSMRYSEPYFGGAISISAEGQQFSTLVEPSGSWAEYKTFDLGVIHISNTGNIKIKLQAVQLSLKNDRHEEALPDIQWFKLTPTTDKSCSAPEDVLSAFNGTSIFNGKTFDGWEGNNGEKSLQWFRIEEGAIVGGSIDRPISQNEFIRTAREYNDFELRLKFRVKYPDNTNSWNGGIQFRSIPNPDIANEMIGYQADIVSWKLGGVFDEQRRWTFIGTPLVADSLQYKDDWNIYIIRCEGHRVRIWLNGQIALDYMEPYACTPHPKYGIIPLKGYIALQIHGDKNPCEIWYKDIEIQEL